MEKLLLQDYTLSSYKIVQSLLVSEYGLRHLKQAKTEEGFVKWGHRIIAVIELCPLLGLIATIIEAIVVKCFFANAIAKPESPAPLSTKTMTWFFRGTQSDCSGPVPVEKVEALRAQLQAKAACGIQFNPKKVVNTIDGGTCSSMSFAFIDDYLKARKETNCQPEQLAKRVVNLGQKFVTSSEEMRIRQAAFNTIEIKPVDTVDFSLNKIQSLANYHRLIVDKSSVEIDTAEIHKISEIADTIDPLPEGTYLVRILKPANNEKLEEHGHSMVYIKEQDLSVFYDPNFGARNLASASSHAQVLFEGFKDVLNAFGNTKARFYRLHHA